ncbi:MAG TPA: conjugative transfer signal peptidase TraF [Longimicrobium sp.]|nr:conjugative transfer signal peptidase TraF [Longimicrobium sp.]
MTRAAAIARVVRAAGCGAVLTTAVAAFAGMRGIVSESMPRGLYLSSAPSGMLRRGDTVEVCLPRPFAEIARERGYLARGVFCSGSVQRIVKAVLAVPGDTVVVTGHGFVVDGRLMPNTAARHRDSRGRPLAPVAPGIYPVKAGTIWLFSTRVPSSFDSRYFGAVPISTVRRRFHPLWTE